MSARLAALALFLALALAGAFAQGFAGLGADADGYALPRPGEAIVFPRDDGAHPDFRVEWWYVTANLSAADGTEYGLQWTLFRTALDPSGDDDAQVWIGHAAVTASDLHLATERMARGGTGQAGVAIEPFSAWIDEWVFRDEASGRQRLFASGPEFAFDVTLQQAGPPVLHGEGGYSVKSALGQASHYYSRPFLAARGVLRLPGRTVTVEGTAWLDREWSSQPLAPDQSGWDWFSLNFDSGEKLMAFRLRSDAGTGFTSASWILPDGRVRTYGEGELSAVPLSTSRVAGREIPTRWRLTLPAESLDVEIEALNPRAWMDLSIPYWEGPVRTSGTHRGCGYLEMTGYRP